MGHVVTFYSYKGGVGRSMALANTATLLSSWGYKTLMVDWDLEAPGLENFFKDYADLEGAADKRGVVDLLSGLWQNEGKDSRKEDWRKLIVSFRLGKSLQPLHLITAGKRDDEYFRKLRDFDVKEFYLNKEGGYFIEDLRNEWKQAYDIVLIDSRTGVTDIGGICTIQLPDILALFFTPTDQGLKGTTKIAEKATMARQDLPFDRLKLLTVPIASRFDVDKEFELTKEWLRRSAEALSGLYADWLPANIKRLDMLELTKVPYKAYFSFGEKLAAMEESVVDPSGLTYAYTNLSAMIANNLQHIEELRERRDLFVRQASNIRERAVPEPEIVSEVTQGILKDHQTWLQSYPKRGNRADFSGWNLSGALLATANLIEALMVETNLSAANLAGANLSLANLSGANLQGADLSESKALAAILKGANLVDAKLSGCNLSKADLSNANLESTDLQGADFTDARLQNTNFSRARLLATQFRGANLRGADFTDAIGPMDVSRADLMGAKLPQQLEDFGSLKTVDTLSANLTFLLFVIPLLGIYALWLMFRTTDANLVRGSGQLAMPLVGLSVSTTRFYVVAPAILFGIYAYLQIFSQGLWTELSNLPAVFPDGRQLHKILRSWYLKSVLGLYEQNKTVIARLQGWLAILLFSWTIPILLACFWLRFLPRHDWYGTGIHIALIMLAICVGWWSARRSRVRFRGSDSQISPKQRRFTFSLGFLPSRRLRNLVRQFSLVMILVFLAGLLGSVSADAIDGYAPVSVTGKLFRSLGYRTYANLGSENLAGANLNGRNLKNAYCDGANLTGAQMVSTNLTDATLRNANLTDANLTLARLDSANLDGAELNHAVLTDASLSDASFSQASLKDVHGLSKEQLQRANRNIFSAQLPDYLQYLVTKVEVDPDTKKQIAELVKKLDGPERLDASDLLVNLYKEDRNRMEIIRALIDSILPVGPTSYRVNLYILRTLGSLQTPWEGTPSQYNRINDLKITNDYKDAIFRYWADKALANFRAPSKTDQR